MLVDSKGKKKKGIILLIYKLTQMIMMKNTGYIILKYVRL